MNLAEFGLPTMNIFAEDERLFCFGSRTWSGARLRSGIQALQPDEGAVQGDRQRQAAHFQGAEAAAPPAKGGKGGPEPRRPRWATTHSTSSQRRWSSPARAQVLLVLLQAGQHDDRVAMRPASWHRSVLPGTFRLVRWRWCGRCGGGELAEKSAARKMHQSPKHLVSAP